jgi:hypothetical protein|tara:strand:+ start:1138 stop:1341 length:204 start_codon:yes stop_codon:yes gene_type:complete
MFKVGDFVEFIYGKHGAQIKRRGLYAEKGYYGMDKVLHDGTTYWVNPDHITAVSMARKDPANEPVDN